MNVCAGKIDIIKLPHMVMNRDYQALLETGGLLDFDGIYNYQEGTVLKRIRDRSVLRMEIPDGDKNRIFYLKRHNPVRPGIKEMIDSLLSQGGSSPGMAEFTTLCQFRKHGIPTAVPVAAGERQVEGGRFESFLLTESFAPFISLEEIIHNHPDLLKGDEGRIRKERLIKSIASLARTLHDQGFNHCDFNATHVLVSPERDNGGFDLALFDLQRIDRKKWMRLKWFIKTMAQLSFTMPDPLFDDRDRLLMFQTYKGSSGMKLIDRFQLYWIRKKIQKISRHTEKIKIRRGKNRGV
jgi:heptose I phosphotransferase